MQWLRSQALIEKSHIDQEPKMDEISNNVIQEPKLLDNVWIMLISKHWSTNFFDNVNRPIMLGTL